MARDTYPRFEANTFDRQKISFFQAVSALGNLPVLAVEGEESNSSGAAERGAKLGVKWNGLKIRAEERREGMEVSNRKSRKRVAREEKTPTDGEKVVHVTRYVEVGEDCSALVREYLGLDETFCITGFLSQPRIHSELNVRSAHMW